MSEERACLAAKVEAQLPPPLQSNTAGSTISIAAGTIPHSGNEKGGGANRNNKTNNNRASSDPGSSITLQTLGRKVRERLETQRSQRREIHRLSAADERCIVPTHNNNSAYKKSKNAQTHSTIRRRSVANAFVDSLNETKSANVKKKRRRSAAVEQPFVESNVYGTGVLFVEDKDVDRWMPDISHIFPENNNNDTNSKANRSSVVQLHGLPLSTTTAHVRRFFNGLDPRRILFLPTKTVSITEKEEEDFRFVVSLPDWDARFDGPRKGGTNQVPRLPPTRRILVKFNSAPTATLAAQRSGEVLRLSSVATTPTSSKSNNTTSTGAVIAVTQLRKDVAACFVKTLAVEVDAGTAGIISIEEFAARVELHLDPIVSAVLWDAAIKDLNLHAVVQQHNPEYLNLIQCADSIRHMPTTAAPMQSKDASNIRIYLSRLKQEVHRLKNACPFPSAEPHDPQLSELDPIVSLTSKCVQKLELAMERCDAALAILTRWNMLKETRPKILVANDATTVAGTTDSSTDIPPQSC